MKDLLLQSYGDQGDLSPTRSDQEQHRRDSHGCNVVGSGVIPALFGRWQMAVLVHNQAMLIWSLN